jgi:hypothetical protein
MASLNRVTETTMRLEPGMLIKTNYSRPYRISEIDRRHPDHINLVCMSPDSNRSQFYLNGWVESDLRSISKTYWRHKTKLDNDQIFILPNDQQL